MLPSTFVALRIQGLDAEPLRRACVGHFVDSTPFDAQARHLFWEELILSRRAYRAATQEEIETLLARA